MCYACQPFLLNGKDTTRTGLYRVKIRSSQRSLWAWFTHRHSHTDRHVQAEHSLTLNLHVNAKLKVKS